jgi:excinuclease ABC subunit B
MGEFKLVSEYKPSGDQPKAIEQLVKGLEDKKEHQVLLGATGTGKTYTISNVIERVQKPTLVLAHNKTLAGQLYSEFKQFFPDNAVEYFVSYYDYYQPEAYVPSSDTYIEKDASTNDEIDQLRHSATASILDRRDVIIVASVSCIYGLGDPEDYKHNMVTLRKNQELKRNGLLKKLVEMQYTRNDIDFHRGTFRVRGDIVEIIPTYHKSNAFRVEFFGDEIDRVREIDTLTGEVINERDVITIFPASHFISTDEKVKIAIERIEEELEGRLKDLKEEGKLVEAQRLEQRTRYDLEMLSEMGFCSGVENYSRHLTLREEGETPYTLMDFFPDDFLLVVDESHVSLPQVRGMYNGDRARKQTLVDFGFRLPSALDNRPLRFEEFNEKLNQAIYVSATPGDYELDIVDRNVTEQIIRPTGLLDPTIEVRETEGQIDDIIHEIRERIKKDERTLVTTLTIRMSEDLTKYLKEVGIKVAYLHSEVKTLERIAIIRDLRMGKYDVVVGINLLREGLDIPEVGLICILDADKQGFLRDTRSLIQTIGRAARNEHGHVILYGDKISDSMSKAMDETARRREIQMEYNEINGIEPKTIRKEITDVIKATYEVEEEAEDYSKMNKKEKEKLLSSLEDQMKKAAKDLDFETAMQLRDLIFELKAQ